MFESAYGEMKSEMLDHQQTFFRSVEESENKFNDAVINIAEQWVKQAQEGNLDAVSDELAAVRLVCWGGAMLKKLTRTPEQLATDRDSLFGFISGSHDTHVGKLLAYVRIKCVVTLKHHLTRGVHSLCRRMSAENGPTNDSRRRWRAHALLSAGATASVWWRSSMCTGRTTLRCKKRWKRRSETRTTTSRLRSDTRSQRVIENTKNKTQHVHVRTIGNAYRFLLRCPAQSRLPVRSLVDVERRPDNVSFDHQAGIPLFATGKQSWQTVASPMVLGVRCLLLASPRVVEPGQGPVLALVEVQQMQQHPWHAWRKCLMQCRTVCPR